jgi:hypothetical protein
VGNWGMPVSHDYAAPFPFTGQLNKVVLEVKKE